MRRDQGSPSLTLRVDSWLVVSTVATRAVLAAVLGVGSATAAAGGWMARGGSEKRGEDQDRQGADAQPGHPVEEVGGAHWGAPSIRIQPACWYSGVPGATAWGCPVETRCSMSCGAALDQSPVAHPGPESTSSHRMSWVPA